MRRAAAVILLLPFLLAWPLPRVLRTHVLAAPDQEAATHVWGLWAALRERSPLVLRTDLFAWPDGTTFVLVDPANLPWFALGSWAGPAAGYAAVLYGGFVLLGIAGAMLAPRAGAPPWLGAWMAMCCPTLIANAADGMTEGMGVGWVGIHVALLVGFCERGGSWRGALAAGALAAAGYAGPYNAVWCAIADAALFAWALGARRGAAIRAVAATAGGFALLAPLGWALIAVRAGDLPGSAARSGLPEIVENPEIFRGGVQTGADLLDPWLPGPLTGGEAPISHTAYLGAVALGLALLAVVRDRRRWPFLAGALAFAALSLGPWLYLGGRAVRAGGAPLLGPAGLMMVGLPVLDRLTRWYRAGAVASLLLAPLAAAAVRGPAVRAIGAALVLADALLLAPLAWPLHATPLPDAAPYGAMDGRNLDAPAILELPPATTAAPPAGRWRDRTGLAQPLHGHPVAGGIMRIPMSAVGREARAVVESMSREGGLTAADRDRLRASGFGWLAIYPEYRPMPAGAREVLERCLGPAVGFSAEVWLFDLRGTGNPALCPLSETGDSEREDVR